MKTFLGITSLLILPGIASVHFLRDYVSGNKTTFKNKLDNTRHNTKFYGLDWGARTDEIIEEKIDTGDLVFYYKEKSLVKILLKKFSFGYYKDKDKSNNYNNIALAIRSQSNLFLVEAINGSPLFTKYEELLADQSIEAVKIRLKSIKTKENLIESVKVLEKIKMNKYHTTQELINDYFTSMNYCKKGITYISTLKKIDINDTSNRNFPICIKPNDSIIFDKSLIVRTRSVN